MYNQEDYLRDFEGSIGFSPEFYRNAAGHLIPVDVEAFDEFGFNLFKAIGNVAKGVVKVAVAPAKFVANTTTGIAKGQNVLKTLAREGKGLASSTVDAAKVAGNVASFIPGIGTGVQFAVQYTATVGEAIAAGKNVINAAGNAVIDAALNSLPGGELTGALIKTVANVAAAGVQGKNVLNSAVHELAANAISLVPSKEAQKVLAGAADAALKGQNVLSGAQAGAINAALSQIPDPNARAVMQATLQRKNPTDVVKVAGTQLLSRAANAIPTGGVATIVTGVTRKSPAQIVAAAKVAGADKLIAAAKAASPANLRNVAARVVTGPSGIRPPVRVVNAAVTAAQKIAALAKTNPALARSQIAALTAAAARGDQLAMSTLATLKTLGVAEAAKKAIAATVTAGAAGDVNAVHALDIVKARLQQRNASAKFTFTLTPDGKIHLEVA